MAMRRTMAVALVGIALLWGGCTQTVPGHAEGTPSPATGRVDGPSPSAAARRPGAPSPSASAVVFSDFTQQAPGVRHRITPADLPPPYQTKSAMNAPALVDRPSDAWPRVPQGFKVDEYASGFDECRAMRTAPNGDVFLAESGAGQVHVLRGVRADGKVQTDEVFAGNLKRPYGIAFYPPGPDPQWVYVGGGGTVRRFPYSNGDLEARGDAETIIDDLPRGGHWTRDLAFSPDGRTLYVAIGSMGNAEDPDTHPEEQGRACILACDPDGRNRRMFATGIRNAAGITIGPDGRLWATVNERDGLGDNLVPDYITHVDDGDFFGWPYFYIGNHPDPQLKGAHPELAARVKTPDVLLQPHNASLQIVFYEGKMFPAEYRGNIFAGEHGSWNRDRRTGYEVIRVLTDAQGKPTGEYEDFMTGFVTADGQVWGRPVGVAVAADGSLLVSDDGSDTVWRVSRTRP